MIDLIKELESKNIYLSLVSNKLELSYDDEIENEVLERIKANKEQLIKFLHKYSDNKGYEEIKLVDELSNYPLSDAQKRLWILGQFSQTSIAYNMPMHIVLDGNYNIESFKKAIFSTIERHEILRTVFREDESGEIRQWILSKEELNFNVDYYDFREDDDREVKVKQYIKEDSVKPFDLAQGPLIRAVLFQVSNDSYVFYYNMHHIISDGWSMDILSRDVLAYYEAYQEDKNVNLPELRIQYKDYTAWQLLQLEEEVSKEHREYWLNQFSKELSVIDLPASKVRPLIKTNNARRLGTYLSRELSEGLKKFCQDNDGVLFMGLVTAFNALFYRYTSQKDFVLGTAVAGRDHIDLEDQMGFYVNTLALRNEIQSEDSFLDLFQRIKGTTLEAYKHQRYPFDRLVEDLKLKRNLSRSLIFDVIITLHNFENKKTNIIKEVSDEIIDLGEASGKFDIELSVKDVGGPLSFEIVYNTDVYDNEMIVCFLKHFKQLLAEGIKSPDTRIDELNFLSKAETNTLVKEFNATEVVYPKDKTIINLFEEQVEKTPNNTAVVFENKAFTYQELNELSNQLAHYLRESYAIQANDLIGIKLERSENLIIAILGILKSGAGYVPIDPSYPQDRIDYIEKDSNSKALLDEAGFSVFKLQSHKYKNTNLQSINIPADLAYVIYTSGTTGQPKGVMVENRSVVRLVKPCSYFPLDQRNILLSTGAISFDATIFEYFGALLNGAKLILASQNDLLQTDKLEEVINKNNVDGFFMTTSWFNYVVDSNIEVFKNVKQLMVGGDAISPHHVKKVFNAFSNIKISNVYGPTENTTFSLIYDIDNSDCTTIPLGKPIPNSSAYILDEALNVVPMGVSGKIYVGGAGVARGYMNRPDLTKEKFVPNPFVQGEKMYNTGDLGRWLADGTIEFLGREDHQVKIRGYRIELEEIKSQLMDKEGIQEATVQVFEAKGSKELIAYFVSNQEEVVSELKDFLSQRLPNYMVPSLFVQLQSMPLTSNGKTDTGALPSPDGLNISSSAEYVAPDTDLEKSLVSIWENLLNSTSIGINDDFFDLGGHSIKIGKLINSYQKTFGVKLGFSELYENTSLTSHAKLIAQSGKSGHTSIQKTAVSESYPLSNAQHRLWVLSQDEENSIAYNMPSYHILKGDFDSNSFKRAIKSTIDRHEILRTVFKENETGEIRQWILSGESLDLNIEYHDFKAKTNKEASIKEYLRKDSAEPFDLQTGPLLRAALLQLSDDTYVFYYNMHHIIGDGWSMDVLANDVMTYYNAYKAGKTADLLPLNIQYKDYSVWQLGQELTKDSKEFWINQFLGELPLTDLPSSQKRPLLKTNNGKNLGTYLSKEVSQQLKTFCQDRGGSLFMGLVASLNALFYKYTAQEDFIIGSPLAGRDHIDLENQIGFYVNTLALRNQVRPEENFNELFERVKNTTFKAYEHQQYPFDQLVEELKLKRDISRSVLFDVMINLNNVKDNQAQREVIKREDIVDYGSVTTKFDVDFNFEEKGNYISFNVKFNTDVYDQYMIETLMKHYKQLLEALLTNSEVSVDTVDYLSKEEEIVLLHNFNATDVKYPEVTVLDLFAKQVKENPDAVAVVFEEKQLTYKELDEKSNQLAHSLLENGLEREELVPICVNRSLEMLVGIIGIIKSGGAYVPIDPGNPKDRIDFILEDTKARFIVTDSSLIDLLAIKKEINSLYLDQTNSLSSTTSAISERVAINDLAYSIYTSGTTGNPKGVLVEHIGLSNYIQHQIAYFSIADKERILLFSNYVFDASAEQIFISISTGATLFIPSYDTIRDIEKIGEYIQENKITHLHATPSFLEIIPKREYPDLKRVVSGGENCSVSLANKWGDSINFINKYGPTEVSITSLIHTIDAKDKSGITIPIGKPVSNTKCYIVSESNKIVPIGVIGELYLSGIQVARGYLNRPDLTNEKFIENPFVKGERAYKTGDLARWLPDGTIEYIGRKDDQVKIRGHRIELGEIEVQLQNINTVDQVVVLAKETSNTKRLVAYIVGANFDKDETIKVLSQKLPEYMIPQIYVKLDSLPLTRNGKIDKKALPNPDFSDITSGKYVAPRTSEEIELALIWQEVLKVKQVGVQDNFFSLGGDSIMAIQLVSRAKKKGIVLKVRDVFTHQTIQEIAKNLKNDISTISEQGILEGDSGLLPINHYFFERKFNNHNHYNQSVLFSVSKDIDAALVDKALGYLVKQHDVLRLRFEQKEGAYQGIFTSDFPGLSLEVVTENNEPISTQITNICNSYQKNLSIENGEIAKFVLIETPSSDQFNRLFIVVHHLAIDGVSWRIMVEDLSSYITSLLANNEVSVEEKTTSYRQWQQRLTEYANTDELLSDFSYWKSIVAKNSILPQDTNYDGITTYAETKSSSISLTKQQTKSLVQNCHHAFGTEINDLLLAALSVSLSKWSGKSEIIIGLEGHGREDLFDDIDLSRTVGWFTSLYPVLLQTNEKDLAATIIQTKETLRRIPNKGIGYGVLRYLASDKKIQSDLSIDVEQIIFNYLGQFGTGESEKGLFDFAPESAGASIGSENKISSKISVNGNLIGDVLSFAWIYDANRYNEETIKTITNNFKDALLEIISLCEETTENIKTPFDYGLNGLVSYNELKSFKQSTHPYAIEDIHRLSPLQEGLLFHSLYDQNPNAYVIQLSFDLVGELQPAHFKTAWELLIKKHSILRTSFYYENLGVPVQCVYDTVNLPFTIIDYSTKNKEELDNDVTSFLDIDSNTSFDLEQAPLFRITLLKLADNRTKLVFTHHHLLFDGWSMPIVFSEFISSYQNLVNEKVLDINVKKDNYKDYIKYIFSKEESKTLSYWKNYLTELEVPSLLPFISDVKKRNKAFGTNNLVLKKDGSYIAKLEAFALSNHLTINTIVQGIWSYLLSRYTGNSTVTFGTIISGRPAELEDVENRVGLYINTIPLCTTVKQEEEVTHWLAGIQMEFTTSREEYGHSSLSQIQKLSGINGELFDSIMVFENYPLEAIQSVETDLRIENIQGKEQTNYALTLKISHATEKALVIDFGYNSSILSDNDAKRIRSHFEELLNSITESATIKELNYLTIPEQKEVLEGFNNTKVEYNLELTVLDLFYEQVANQPNSTALIFEETALSFKELDKKSNQLAQYLKEQGVQKEQLIPICIDRSLEMIVGILAIIKAGGAYVPIDPDYPKDRINYIVEDTQAKIVLSSVQYADKIDSIPVISLDAFEYELFSGDFSGESLSPNQLSYCIYTSGTTGNPKGVLNEHVGLLNRLLWMRDDLNINESSVILQKTTYTFDVSVWELIMPLVVGCKMVIARPEGHKDPEYLQDVIENKAVTIIHFVPSMLGVFLENLENNRCQNLKHVVCSGEALPSSMVCNFKEKLTTTRIHNLYGPTEAAIDVTTIDLTTIDTQIEGVSIGKSVANTQLYIVNKTMDLQAVGVAGELLIGGIQVSRGYLNKPELTSEKFIISPFIKGQRLYRTGDLAKWHSDGSIEYLGRIDKQVKIRGFRIELGEIENQLELLPAIKQAVVVVRENENASKQLIAYVIDGGNFNDKEAINRLKEILPDYMVPHVYITLESFPLTRNGKIDTKSLPEPNSSNLIFEDYVAPKNQTEEQLVLIWQEDLKIDTIGVRDNYFTLGGDSIKMIRLVSKIKKTFDVQFQIASFYDNPIIEDLALFIAGISTKNNDYDALIKETEASLIALENVILANHPSADNVANVYPLSDIQLGMIVTSQLMRDKGEFGIYHDQFLFQFALVDVDLLHQAMHLLVKKHETLRTSYHLYEYDQQVQIIHNEIPINIGFEDLSNIKISKDKEEYLKNFFRKEREQNPFDITQAPLWRINIFQINSTEIIFALQFHHAILDGWSEKSLRIELFKIYDALKNDKNYRPEALKCSMRDSILSDILERKNESNKIYWKNRMSDYTRLDIFTEENQSDIVSKVYGPEFKNRLLEVSKKNRISPKTLFFSGYIYSLGLLSYKKDITVGLVSHRRPFVEDGEKLMGCFLNTVPFRSKNTLSTASSWIDYVTTIQSDLEELKGKDRISLFDISQLMEENAINENPFFDTIFNYVDFHVLNELIEDKEFIATQSKRENENFSYQSFESTNTFLDFSINLTGDSCSVTIKSKRKLRSNHQLKDLMQYFENFLNNFLDNPANEINSLDILPQAEQDKLLIEFNDTQADYASNKTMVDLFTEQVTKTPDNIAIIFEGKQFTYKDLDKLSNQLANYLLSEYNIQSEDLIAVKLDRSEWLVISLLAVLKCGAAYVPIDPNYPVQRIKYIEDDSNCKVTINQDLLTAFANQETVIDKLPEVSISSNNLAYIIYTSGSTGKPKGVMIEHRSAVAMLSWSINEFSDTDFDIMYAVTSHCFDLSIFELFYPLSIGKKVRLLNNGLSIEDFLQEDEKILINTVPSVIQTLLDKKVSFNNVIAINLAGEAFPVTIANHFKDSKIVLRNLYGPSEDTTYSTYQKLEGSYEQSVPIGRPLENTQVYILSENLELQSLGVIGELCISGDGLARGYLNRPDLTEEKFINHPFKKGERMYKTGDLARWFSDGNIEFLGRTDNQVKIRGHRIELGEIESQLSSKESIKEVAVIVENKESDKQIVAYFISDKEENANDLFAFLSNSLPNYMIPDSYIQIETMPLNSNGKIDKKKLVESNGLNLSVEVPYEAPRNEIEQKLAKICEELLQRDKLGVKDNFFTLGVNSLKAIQFTSRISKEFDVKVDFVTLFSNPTIEKMAVEIETSLWANNDLFITNEDSELESISI
ncbi:non-ribosomal peptide synthetase [Flavobacterium sp. MC2016-06]|jgi:amino acid adenylation domain-containing protein/non-ribosomal peptide synthase protein (TIGR01720 family)|uniref:non-ribosomal peptide synthetase n=1 Tax=Flavobacterium sp. MC2016-06 TaxID=2676308 RepID=UPI0012BAD238|nr:non-ribosomal peptide synthetase [Flavobacterium sp. MC2016-06]MBU3862219.1 amino acid adenylation domain-containing protein [Flavobacterium sp. MC2016-06]